MTSIIIGCKTCNINLRVSSMDVDSRYFLDNYGKISRDKRVPLTLPCPNCKKDMERLDSKPDLCLTDKMEF